MTEDWTAARFAALGTTAVVAVAAPDVLDEARAAVEAVIAAVDIACSRFRDDSELMGVNRARGRTTPVSPTLHEALRVALWAAAVTDGLVDPTVGEAVRLLGYDRDFGAIARLGPPLPTRVVKVPGWQAVRLDDCPPAVTVPAGVQLDLGATAKAWCADRAADAAATATGQGVLVSLGGDIAVAGPAPADGWVVQLADRHDAPADGSGPCVAITVGGLATSSTAARRWWRGSSALHHIVDPGTGSVAEPCWRTVSVAAASSADANAAATAAIILGPAAPSWLAGQGLVARLVGEDGTIETVGGWPADRPEPAPAGRRPA
jgi:thiamine biosynthesis lipoprotein